MSSGLFFHSRCTVPAGLEPLASYGSNIIVDWDAEDETSDAYLKAGFMAAKGSSVDSCRFKGEHRFPEPGNFATI